MRKELLELKKEREKKEKMEDFIVLFNGGSCDKF